MIDFPENTLPVPDVMDALLDLEQRCLRAVENLPEVGGIEGLWDGLVFEVAGARVVAAMNEVSEMLPYRERVTRVPGAKAWMLGLANVRGSLLPVIDLQVFLGGNPIVPSKSARILVLRLRGLVAGLLVASVQGMRHFNIEERLANVRVKGTLGAFIYEAFSQEGETWPVVSMHALAADPEFRSAAL